MAGWNIQCISEWGLVITKTCHELLIHEILSMKILFKIYEIILWLYRRLQSVFIGIISWILHVVQRLSLKNQEDIHFVIKAWNLVKICSKLCWMFWGWVPPKYDLIWSIVCSFYLPLNYMFRVIEKLSAHISRSFPVCYNVLHMHKGLYSRDRLRKIVSTILIWQDF